MHRSVKYLKWFALAFVAGFLLPRSYGPLLSADVLKSKYDGGTLEEVITQYHLDQNEIVNENYLALLLDEDFAQSGYVAYPPNLEGSTEPNCENNVSTFCLAVALNANLEEFEKFLVNHQDSLDFSPDDDETTGPTSIQEAFNEASTQRTTVDEQIQLATETMDLTLAVYNQVQLVYPVHVEMLKLVENLDDYRGNLAEVRNIIELYPSKFNGASTAQCK